MVEFWEYIDPKRRSPFARWFGRLSAQAAAKTATALVRTEQGRLSGVAGVGVGVLECRIDFGPGYRVYFGKDGDALIILLGGGTRQRQKRDIEAVRNY